MATEKQLQEGIQTVLQAVSRFEAEDVTINDWDVLDRPGVQAPFVIIINEDEFDSRMDTTDTQESETVKAWLLVWLGARTWKEAYDDLRDTRQAIKDAFNTIGSTARSAGGLEGVNIRRLRSLSEIGYIYAQGVDPEEQVDATPEYLAQMLGFDVEQF